MLSDIGTATAEELDRQQGITVDAASAKETGIDTLSNINITQQELPMPPSLKTKSSRLEMPTLRRHGSSIAAPPAPGATILTASLDMGTALPRLGSKAKWEGIELASKANTMATSENATMVVMGQGSGAGPELPSAPSLPAPDTPKLSVPSIMLHTSQQQHFDDSRDLLSGDEPTDPAGAAKAAAKERAMARVILFVSVMCYGVGLFLVSLPSKLDTMEHAKKERGLPEEVPGFVSSSVAVSLGRSFGLFIIILSTTKGLRHSFEAGIGPGPYLQKANILGFTAPMISSIGYVTYDQLLRQGGDISVYSAATSLHTAIPVIWAFLVLGEKLTWKKSLGLILAFGSVFLLSMKEDTGAGDSAANSTQTEEEKSAQADTDALTIILLISTNLLWGSSLIARSAAARMRPWLNALMTFFYGQVFHFIFSFILFIGLGGINAFVHAFTAWTAFIIFGHVVISFGAVSYTKLTSGKDTATWGALTQLNVMVTILLSIIVFGDVVTLIRGLGFGLMITSMLLLAIK